MSTLYRMLAFSLLLNFSWTSSEAQMITDSMENTIPLDPDIRYGQLQNGFTYFIKPIEGDQSKLYLQLYHKAGINQEDAEQPEIAHAVEHLSVKASESFPSGIHNALILKNLGMGRSDISAHTGRRGTNYFVEVPQGSSEA